MNLHGHATVSYDVNLGIVMMMFISATTKGIIVIVIIITCYSEEGTEGGNTPGVKEGGQGARPEGGKKGGHSAGRPAMARSAVRGVR